jgi:chromosome segregation ATPase
LLAAWLRARLGVEDRLGELEAKLDQLGGGHDQLAASVSEHLAALQAGHDELERLASTSHERLDALTDALERQRQALAAFEEALSDLERGQTSLARALTPPTPRE